MSSEYINIPNYGSGSWKDPVTTVTALPSIGNSQGDVRVALDTGVIYEWIGTSWIAATSPTAVYVTSLNGLTGPVTLSAGTGIGINQSGNNLTINNTNSSAIWGSITGTLSNQTDLNTALNAKQSGPLSGDVTTASTASAATTVESVGGKTASQVSTSVDDTTAATDANTASTIVKRDVSGNFSAGTITASLSGNATSATTATNFSGSLSGDVTGTQSATVVSSVGGKTASQVSTSVDDTIAATSSNTASTIVKRDASGLTALSTAQLNGPTSGNIQLKAADTTTSYSVKFPNAQGGAGSYLSNDGSGNLFWGQAIPNFGDGSDGAYTASSGLFTLVRDMYWASVTLTGTAQINTAGYRIFVKGILDISAAGTQAIYNNGGTGGNSTSQTGGAVGAAAPGASVGAAAAGSAGATGVIGAGVQAAVSIAPQNGGDTRSSGAAGAGAGGSGGAQRAGIVATNVFPIRRYATELLRGATLIVPGAGGPGGGAGAGDNATLANTCGGGGGGGGGGIVAIWANTINRSASTATSCIQALGGTGGNGRPGQGIYTFTIPAGSTASINTVYSNNGQNFTVTAPLLVAGTSLVTQVNSGGGGPLTSGTLTLVSGTGSSSITFTAVAASSSAAASATTIGGGGGGSGGSGGWVMLQYQNLTGTTATNCINVSGGQGGAGGYGANNYTFTVTAGQTASVGATFTNNNQTFTVTTALLVAATTLICVGTGAPTASGTLTKAIGTSSGNITYSSFVGGVTFNSGGQGGIGGNGGRVTLYNALTNTSTDTITGTATAVAGASGPVPTYGTAGGVNLVNL